MSGPASRRAASASSPDARRRGRQSPASPPAELTHPRAPFVSIPSRQRGRSSHEANRLAPRRGTRSRAGARRLGCACGGAAGRRADLGFARVRGEGPGLEQHRRGEVRPDRQPPGARRHGPLRLQDLRRERPDESAAPGHVPAARDPRRERVLAGRGHGSRHEPEADHRLARPAARRRRPGGVSGHRHAGVEEPEPGLPLGLLRHLVRGPGEPEADRRLRGGAGRPHVQLHREVPLHLDRRARAPRRPGRARAVRPGRPW